MSFYGYTPIAKDYSYVERAGGQIGQAAGAVAGQVVAKRKEKKNEEAFKTELGNRKKAAVAELTGYGMSIDEAEKVVNKHLWDKLPSETWEKAGERLRAGAEKLDGVITARRQNQNYDTMWNDEFNTKQIIPGAEKSVDWKGTAEEPGVKPGNMSGAQLRDNYTQRLNGGANSSGTSLGDSYNRYMLGDRANSVGSKPDTTGSGDMGYGGVGNGTDELIGGYGDNPRYKLSLDREYKLDAEPGKGTVERTQRPLSERLSILSNRYAIGDISEAQYKAKRDELMNEREDVKESVKAEALAKEAGDKRAHENSLEEVKEKHDWNKAKLQSETQIRVAEIMARDRWALSLTNNEKDYLNQYAKAAKDSAEALSDIEIANDALSNGSLTTQLKTTARARNITGDNATAIATQLLTKANEKLASSQSTMAGIKQNMNSSTVKAIEEKEREVRANIEQQQEAQKKRVTYKLQMPLGKAGEYRKKARGTLPPSATGEEIDRMADKLYEKDLKENKGVLGTIKKTVRSIGKGFSGDGDD